MAIKQPASPARLAIGGMLAMASAFGIGRFVYTPILPVMIGDGALTPASAAIRSRRRVSAR